MNPQIRALREERSRLRTTLLAHPYPSKQCSDEIQARIKQIECELEDLYRDWFCGRDESMAKLDNSGS